MHAYVAVSAATPTRLKGTTDKNFSVDKYFELQKKILELEAKKRAGVAKTSSPKTDFDGSSVLSTDGGIPLDYEAKNTSSSQSCVSKPALGLAAPVKKIRTLLLRSVREVLVM
ncbi:hypothetical protein PHMEG_00012936 [Phytophthora megakarya]|uniref:Uncharacterized protein n=1 Tax=Phytophthora megakarya TaxID=4795 RepID=A0A225W8I2_9STRA|nr:hypothetical protein PHMEG_00012936 [Phytophthora megakarya]